MILRRIIQHVQDQNWTAIAIDFVIVVVGVFIGIQVSNWNAEQSERHDYERALERYAAEIDANLADLQDLEARALDRRAIVFAALDTLLTCQDSPDNRRTVEAGVRLIIGTYGVGIRTTSLHELTESAPLLAQQSAAERRLLNDTRVRIDYLLGSGAELESRPHAIAVQDNPMLGLGEREIDEFEKYTRGADHLPALHPLVLAEPLDVACRDDALVKAFYTWEYWQSFVPNLTRGIQETLEDSREGLGL
ncbi:hypothetical protein [Rubrivirga sp. IMCC45206]|uniref:hypothetical protein n=1 Tax=Rubrivirga sp. IMCC45206 TaxID=3391614 RepID=UPI00398FC01B